jgi:hypothetical protein
MMAAMMLEMQRIEAARLIFIRFISQIEINSNQGNQDDGHDSKEWPGADEVPHCQLSFLATQRSWCEFNCFPSESRYPLVAAAARKGFG